MPDVSEPDVATALTKFWAVSILHEKRAIHDDHIIRVTYAGRSPIDGAAFLMVKHELGKQGAFDHKIPDTAYVTGVF